MPTITLIRHAMPHIDPTTPPSTWELTPEARATARELTLPPGPHHHTASTEPKAIDTLRQLTDQHIHTDPGFNEVHRPHTPDGDTHRTLAATYLAGTPHPGWEPHTTVTTRFDHAVRHHLHTATGKHLTIATHGTILTLWLASITGMPDPVTYWRQLTFPDLITIELPEQWLHQQPTTT